MSKLKAFSGQCAFYNVGSRVKADLVTIGGFTPDFKYIASALESQVDLSPSLEINRSNAKIACHLKNNLSIIFRVINFLLVHAKFFLVRAAGRRNYAVLSKREMSFGRTIFPLSSLFERKNIRHSTNE